MHSHSLFLTLFLYILRNFDLAVLCFKFFNTFADEIKYLPVYTSSVIFCDISKLIM